MNKHGARGDGSEPIDFFLSARERGNRLRVSVSASPILEHSVDAVAPGAGPWEAGTVLRREK